MAVVVEVPDEHMSRHARRLIGRRAGVRVVISGESNGRGNFGQNDSEAPRKILVLDDAHHTPSELLNLLHDGVWAVLPAEASDFDARLRDCVDRVRAGSSPLLTGLAEDRGEVDAFLQALRQRVSQRRERSRSGPENPLSERETQILQRISQGVTSAEIASEMGFQLQTVKNKVTTILTKTHARSRTHAVTIALGNGWIRSA